MTGSLEFWTLQLPGWLLVLYLLVAQCTAAFSYQFGVRIGTQEPAARITEIGVAIFWGFALADLVFYTPLLALGLAGRLAEATWSGVVLGAALGITVYWPIVCLATVARARNAPGWTLPKERDYWIVLPLIALWGFWALFLMLRGG